MAVAATVSVKSGRAIEWFGLEETLKLLSFQAPAMRRHLSLDQTAQGPIHAGLELLQQKEIRKDMWEVAISYVRPENVFKKKKKRRPN